MSQVKSINKSMIGKGSSLCPSSMKRDEDGWRFLVVGSNIIATMGGGYWCVQNVLDSVEVENLAVWVGKDEVRELIKTYGIK